MGVQKKDGTSKSVFLGPGDSKWPFHPLFGSPQQPFEGVTWTHSPSQKGHDRRIAREMVSFFWSNYSDLTRPHPKWWFSKGNPLISVKSRLVKYYNLARFLYRHLLVNFRNAKNERWDGVTSWAPHEFPLISREVCQCLHECWCFMMYFLVKQKSAMGVDVLTSCFICHGRWKKPARFSSESSFPYNMTKGTTCFTLLGTITGPLVSRHFWRWFTWNWNSLTWFTWTWHPEIVDSFWKAWFWANFIATNPPGAVTLGGEK